MNCHSYENQYIVNDEFNLMASCLVKKYPEIFQSINSQKICCANITTTEISQTKILWKIHRVKMPVALHCQYDYYVVFRSADWDDFDEVKKMGVAGEVLMCLPNYPLTCNTSLSNN